MVLPPAHQSFEALPSHMSPVDSLAAKKLAKWNLILAKIGPDRANAHQWDWEANNYLPRYEYQPIDSITDIWDEWASGLNGFMSIRDMTEMWGARWRRNIPSKKAEHSRRNAVVELVVELLKRPRWTIALIRRFLRDRYEDTYKPRAFCDYLKSGSRSGFQSVLVAGGSYA